MDGNLLLFYLSELGHGHWARFTDALESLEAEWKRSTHALQLSKLGHVEFDFMHRPKRWAVCQPTLAWLPGTDAHPHRAILCGARTKSLLNTLHNKARRFGCKIAEESQLYNPNAIFIEAAEQYQLHQLSEAVKLANEPKSAERLAHCLPTLNTYRQLCKPRPEPSGYGIHQFDLNAKRWLEVERSTKNGLYAYAMVDGTYIHCYKRASTFFDVPRDIGFYFWLSDQKNQILKYDSATLTLTVPYYADLPALYARAAVLCSGLLPKLTNGSYIYQSVSTSVAYNITTKLNQAIII